MVIAGYLVSVFIGVSLGLIGGGGSILTVPVLVYLFRIDPVLATAYSLFIVGVTSTAGSISYLKKGWVNIKTAIVFGVPSIAAIFFTRTYVLPAIPQEIFSIATIVVTKNMLLMSLFAMLMIAASYSMIRKNRAKDEHGEQHKQYNLVPLMIQGALVGIVTGLMGAGGGFLIIPALVNLQKMPIKMAIGTSLVIIAANSLLGFFFSLPYVPVQWWFLISITAVAVIGIWLGTYLSVKMDSKKLKPAFGWFVLVMGVYILAKEMLR